MFLHVLWHDDSGDTKNALDSSVGEFNAFCKCKLCLIGSADINDFKVLSTYPPGDLYRVEYATFPKFKIRFYF